MRISDQGGPLSPTTVITSGSRAHRFPSFLPDGRHFVYSVTPGVDFVNAIELGSVDGVAGRKIEDAINGAVYAAPGYLVFFRDGAVRARRFDATSLQPSGPALALPGLDFISMNADGAPMVAVSANGVIVQPAISEQPQVPRLGGSPWSRGRPLAHARRALLQGRDCSGRSSGGGRVRGHAPPNRR